MSDHEFQTLEKSKRDWQIIVEAARTVAAGSSLQARDIMGYTFVVLLWSFVIFGPGVAF